MTFLFITSVENFIYNYVNNLQVYKGPYGHLKKKFSSEKKYFNTVSSGKEGWYYYTKTCAPEGARILRSTSPPSSNISERANANEIIDFSSNNENEKKVQLEDDTNQLISELSFFELYSKIIKSEKRTYGWHEALKSYYFLEEELEKRFYHYKKFLNELNAQLKVSKEVRDQLSKWITDDFIRKITEIAREIYGFFD